MLNDVICAATAMSVAFTPSRLHDVVSIEGLGVEHLAYFGCERCSREVVGEGRVEGIG